MKMKPKPTLLKLPKIQVLKPGDDPPEGFLCSMCFEQKLFGEMGVLPFWNDTAEAFLTSYRCNACWQPSLDDTRMRLSAPTEAARERFLFFLRSHSQNVLAAAYEAATEAMAARIADDFLYDVEQNPKVLFSTPTKLKDYFRPHPVH